MENQITFTISGLTLDEANAILAGLQELPAKVCNPLSEKIKQQANEQVAAWQAASQPQAPAPANDE